MPTTFTAPAAPAPPTFDTGIEAAAEKAEVEDKSDAWPALVDPIDNPDLYNRLFRINYR